MDVTTVSKATAGLRVFLEFGFFYAGLSKYLHGSTWTVHPRSSAPGG